MSLAIGREIMDFPGLTHESAALSECSALLSLLRRLVLLPGRLADVLDIDPVEAALAIW